MVQTLTTPSAPLIRMLRNRMTVGAVSDRALFLKDGLFPFLREKHAVGDRAHSHAVAKHPYQRRRRGGQAQAMLSLVRNK
jgi:hypothetical protein